MSDRIEENLEKAISMMEAASHGNADVILFPEIQLGPFFPQYEDFDVSALVTELDDPVVTKLQAACRRLGIIASPNVYLQDGGQLYDASLLIDRDGSILGISKMVHITQAPGFYEQNYYAPSSEGFGCSIQAPGGSA